MKRKMIVTVTVLILGLGVGAYRFTHHPVKCQLQGKVMAEDYSCVNQSFYD